MNMPPWTLMDPPPGDDTRDPGTVATGLPPCDWPLPLGQARVALRALRMEDAGAFLDYRSDPEVARFQGWSAMDASTACEFIKTMEGVTGPRAGAWIQLGIVLCESDRLIGDIGLRLGDDGKAAQIGYSCAPGFQRQGLTTEAVGVLIDALVRFTACETVHALVDPRNTASCRLLLRLCFRQVEPAGDAPGSSDIEELAYELDLGDRSSFMRRQNAGDHCRSDPRPPIANRPRAGSATHRRNRVARTPARAMHRRWTG